MQVNCSLCVKLLLVILKILTYMNVNICGEMMSDDDRYRAPALDKGLDMLELLAEIDGGLTQAEIAKSLGRTPNELYRMLDRLQKRGYVTRIDGDRFALTLKMFGLAQLHAPTRRLVSYATPLMRELAAKARQAVHLSVFDRGQIVVVAQQEAPDYWGISVRVGSHISLFDTGSGHILLAFNAPERREMMIWKTGSTPESPCQPAWSSGSTGSVSWVLKACPRLRRRAFSTFPRRSLPGMATPSPH